MEVARVEEDVREIRSDDERDQVFELIDTQLAIVGGGVGVVNLN